MVRIARSVEDVCEMGERLDGLLFVKLDVSVRKKMLSRAQLATKPLYGR